MNTIRTACVVGARPNFMKMAPLWRELQRCPAFSPYLIHTGQHFSASMSDRFFEELGLPDPDLHLNAGAGTPVTQIAKIMQGLEASFSEQNPNLVLVVGDVNSTVSAALVAAKMGIPLAHVEAGLRSFDRRMPEEINRLVTDSLSDFLFASEPSGVDNLRAEGVSPERIFFVGNVMIDTLLKSRSLAAQSTVLQEWGLSRGEYALVTLHRPSNVDDPRQLEQLLRFLVELRQRLPVVFPVHPRTKARIEVAGVDLEGILLTPPMGYLDFVRLMSDARLVLTDSGGIQEETTILQTPCFTIRENTERPVTITCGTNRLAGTDPRVVLRAVDEFLASPTAPVTAIPELWDGRASERIVRILEEKLTAALASSFALAHA